ncbi:MAG: serine/threonine-protein kinase [Coriobacteriia bacterium]|nr:serine/threonine-protein kinase [Coriobacteriia bacterium]
MEQQLILDRYRPLDELGEGGFATVTLAWDTRMQRRVAIKRLKLPRDHTGAILQNPPGLAEARTAAMLNHPAIVTVYDFETDADEAFLIMEYVDGASLEDLLDDVGGALTLDESAAVLDAVCSALEFAHDNGVLHLDMKPANVLVTRDGRVKVADFGMAALSTATGHGASWGGTIGYMPVEQLEGGLVTEASDEWAVAVLAYECLTGANPFDSRDIRAAVATIVGTDPPRPSAYERELSRGIDDVLLAGLGPQPIDRYPTVASFADALLPHLGDPATGQDSLADLVDAYADEELAAEEPGWQRVGLWDRWRSPAGGLALRAIAAAESGWLAWVGLAPTHLEPLPLAGAAGLVALAGALAPSLGTGLGLLAFAIGLFALHVWLLGALFALGAVLWWWFLARRSAGAAVLPLSAPVLGVARVGYLTPLLAGFSLPPLTAMAAGLVGGVLMLLASASSGQVAPYVAVSPQLLANPAAGLLVSAHVAKAFTDPAAWISLLGWPVAALAMSLLSRRATRFSAVVGTVVGGGVLLGANVLARMAAATLHGAGKGAAAWTGTTFAWSLAGSLILMMLVIVLGAPVRAEEEDLVHAAYESDD